MTLPAWQQTDIGAWTLTDAAGMDLAFVHDSEGVPGRFGARYHATVFDAALGSYPTLAGAQQACRDELVRISRGATPGGPRRWAGTLLLFGLFFGLIAAVLWSMATGGGLLG